MRRTEDIEIKMVFLGDKLANMRSIYQQWLLVGDAVWQDFNQTDPEQHRWYYRTIAESIRELEESPAWKEYDRLIRVVFREEQTHDTEYNIPHCR